MINSRKAVDIHGGISKWGRLRALPVAEEASKKEWQRSKREHGGARALGTATGHNEAVKSAEAP